MKITNNNPQEVLSEPLDTPIQFDLTPQSKARIKELADGNISAYMRAAVGDKQRFHVLDPNGDIARLLIEANDTIRCALREHNISKDNASHLMLRLDKIQDALDVLLHERDGDNTHATTDITVSGNTEKMKSSHIQFLVTKTMAQYISDRADELGMSVSQFLRVAALTTRPVIVFGMAKYVVSGVIELNASVDTLINDHICDSQVGNELKARAKAIFDSCIEIATLLTNVSAIDDAVAKEEE